MIDSQSRRSSRPRNTGGRKTINRLRKRAIQVFTLNIVVLVTLFVLYGELSWNFTAGAWFTAAGRLSALLGTNLILVQLALIARNPVLERAFGMDVLTRWHRKLGEVGFTMIVVHVVTIIVGYSFMTNRNVIDETRSMIVEMRDILMAVAAFALIVLVVATSIRRARRKLRRETWHFIHLYSYLAIALAVPHQIFTGSDFAASLPSEIYWIAVYTSAIGSIVLFRITQPLKSLIQHDLRVNRVVVENSDSLSIYIRGRNVKKMGAQAGQFFIWRFLARHYWFEAHPYSLSAPPRNNELRITVKNLGDGSSSLKYITAGTRVIAEGPLGAFTTERSNLSDIVLIGGGIGITPLRAIAEQAARSHAYVTLIYRARNAADLVFHAELVALADRLDVQLHIIVGSQNELGNESPFSPRNLLRLAPQIAYSDIYACGPPSMVDQIRKSAHALNIPADQVVFEQFEF